MVVDMTPPRVLTVPTRWFDFAVPDTIQRGKIK